jgi:hypothetical protein
MKENKIDYSNSEFTDLIRITRKHKKYLRSLKGEKRSLAGKLFFILEQHREANEKNKTKNLSLLIS